MPKMCKVLLVAVVVLLVGFGTVSTMYFRHQETVLFYSQGMYIEQMWLVNAELTDIAAKGLDPSSGDWEEFWGSLFFESGLLMGMLESEWPTCPEATTLIDYMTTTFRRDGAPGGGDMTVAQTPLSRYADYQYCLYNAINMPPYLGSERLAPYSADLLKKIEDARKQQYLDLLKVRNGKNRTLFYSTVMQYERQMAEILSYSRP